MDSEQSELRLVYSGVLSPARDSGLPERLASLHDQLITVIQECSPSAVAIESPFVARNVRAAMAIGQAQAVVMVAAAQHALPVSTYSPAEVKKAVTDYGGSSKEQVLEMVTVLLGMAQRPEATDEADALAVAICHVNASRVRELVIRE